MVKKLNIFYYEILMDMYEFLTSMAQVVTGVSLPPSNGYTCATATTVNYWPIVAAIMSACELLPIQT